MGDSDISYIKELGRYSIPGAGVNSVGGAVNNKVLVWGRLEGEYDTLGLDLLARGTLRALGVENADFFTFEMRQAGVTGTRTNPTTLKLFKAHLQQTTVPGRIFCFDQLGAASPAEPSDSDIITLDFICLGDDARVPVLT